MFGSRKSSPASNGPSLFSGVDTLTGEGLRQVTGMQEEDVMRYAGLTLRKGRQKRAEEEDEENMLEWYKWDIPIMLSFNPQDMSDSDTTIEVSTFAELAAGIEELVKQNKMNTVFPPFVKESSILGDVVVHSITNSSYMSFLCHMTLENYESEFPPTVVKTVGKMIPANLYIPMEAKPGEIHIIRKMGREEVCGSWLAGRHPGVAVDRLMHDVRPARDGKSFHVPPDSPVVDFINDVLTTNASTKVSLSESSTSSEKMKYREELARLRKATFGVETIDPKGNHLLVSSKTFMKAHEQIKADNAENLTLFQFLSKVKMSMFRAFRSVAPFNMENDMELMSRFPENQRAIAYQRRVTVTFVVQLSIGYLPEK